MSIFVLTKHSVTHEEIVSYEAGDPAVHISEGAWLKLGSKFDAFAPMEVAEAAEITACPAVINSLRTDSGSFNSGNPAYTFIDNNETVTIIRNWNDLMVTTDDVVDGGTWVIGEELTVIGGAFVKITTPATQHKFGVYIGDDESGKVEGGKVIQLIRQIAA